MVLCQYCKKYGKENVLEYIPSRLQYYCKVCEYRYSEDSINESMPKKEAPKKAEPKRREEPKMSPKKVGGHIEEPKTPSTKKQELTDARWTNKKK